MTNRNLFNPRLIKIHVRHSGALNDGACTGGFWIRSCNFSLVTTVNHFVNDCTNSVFSVFVPASSITTFMKFVYSFCIWVISTHEIALANILRDVLVLLDVADVHQCNKVAFPYLFCFVPSLWLPCISFSLLPLHLKSTFLGVKDLLFVLRGFPRHASLRNRSPQSSEPYVTLDSRCSLNRTTFGVHTPFFSSSHLRVSRTPRNF